MKCGSEGAWLILRKGRRGPRNVKIIFPSLITSFSMICGFAAMVLAMDGRVVMGCYLVMVAAILDGLDGKVARLTNTASAFGIQYDSMADLVSFGVAPAVLYHRFFLNELQRDSLWVLLPIMFMLCGAIRLARFNVTASIYGKAFFTGMPIPVAAVALSIWAPLSEWVAGRSWLASSFFGGFFDRPHLFPFSIILISVLSLTMISSMKFDTWDNFWLRKYRRKSVNFFVLAAFHSLLFIHFVIYMSAIATYYVLMMYGRSLKDYILRRVSEPSSEEDSTFEEDASIDELVSTEEAQP